MQTNYLSWGEAKALFDSRGFAESSYQNLYEEEYILHPGSALVTGAFPLNGHDRHPWRDTTPDAATGYIVDGDLTVDGNILDWDDGASALIVLGNLRAANIYLSCDAKLLVQGNVEVDTFVGDMTDKLVMIHGDLRTGVTIMWDGFCPDLVGGCLYGRTLAPGYIDLPGEAIGRVEDPTLDVPVADLLVPEVLVDADPDDPYAVELGVHKRRLYDRIAQGLPVVQDGRRVAALQTPT
ncbi:hypothetical protein [Dactylosporangium sp. NPDC048998]|uniref:hypothetical protein n=1 Tax=Dactylosporangium sp. NPDC048998 TaxID=3363976 RepID=UPI003710A245